jgi:hypothetical protein
MQMLLCVIKVTLVGRWSWRERPCGCGVPHPHGCGVPHSRPGTQPRGVGNGRPRSLPCPLNPYEHLLEVYLFCFDIEVCKVLTGKSKGSTLQGVSQSLLTHFWGGGSFFVVGDGPTNLASPRLHRRRKFLTASAIAQLILLEARPDLGWKCR